MPHDHEKMKLSQEERDRIGAHLYSMLRAYRADRQYLEQEWLRNQRQVRGKYDPEIEKNFEDGFSRVYPKDTRVKVKAYVSKMMELMFPATGKNYSLRPSPIPSIPEQELDVLIQTLAAESVDEQGQPVPIRSEQIERAVHEFAAKRAWAMEKRIDDQLAELDYPAKCKGTLRRGATYGWGVLKGPSVVMEQERDWQFDPLLNQYVPVVNDIYKPGFEEARIWDIYPDLTAKTWDQQEAIFERIEFTRAGLRDLMSDSRYDRKELKRILDENPDGNHEEQNFEIELRSLNNIENTDSTKRKRFEMFRYRGYLNYQQLGMEASEEMEDKLVEVWFMNSRVMRVNTKPFGDRPSDIYHVYIHGDEDDEGPLTGIGLPVDLRDSQLSICSVSRMIMDNAASTAGPVTEINLDLLAKNRAIPKVRAFSTIYRTGRGNEANYPAIREYQFNSRVPELINLRKDLREQMDLESNIPSWTVGQVTGLGEAFRTSNNMSMMSGGANVIHKDSARAFDRFTTSVIRSLIRFNTEFLADTSPEILGDYDVMPLGVISLVAKEVRGAALDQLMVTLTPEEQAILKKRPILIERLKSRDLPVDELVEDELRSQEILSGMAQAQAQAAQVEQGLTQARTAQANAQAQKAVTDADATARRLEAEINRITAEVEEILASAQTKSGKLNLERVKTLLDQIARRNESGRGTGAPGESAQSPQPGLAADTGAFAGAV